MATIAELIPNDTRSQLGQRSSGPYHGEPRSFRQVAEWISLIRADLARLRAEYAWGLQHGKPATEGHAAWFAELRWEILATDRRLTDLERWRKQRNLTGVYRVRRE